MRRTGLNDYYMPFYLQHMREQHTQLATLKAQLDSLTSKTAAKEQSEAGTLAHAILCAGPECCRTDAPILGPGMGGRLMIGGPGGMPPQATGCVAPVEPNELTISPPRIGWEGATAPPTG